jgi:hypothetical protein
VAHLQSEVATVVDPRATAAVTVAPAVLQAMAQEDLRDHGAAKTRLLAEVKVVVAAGATIVARRRLLAVARALPLDPSLPLAASNQLLHPHLLSAAAKVGVMHHRHHHRLHLLLHHLLPLHL